MAERSVGRLTKLNNKHLNILDMRMKEHTKTIKRNYNRIRSSRNSARLQLKRDNGVDMLTAEEEEKIEDKYEKKYLDSLVKENQRFSQWLNNYQFENINRSKNTLEELLEEVQNPAPKRQRLEREPSIESLPLSQFGDLGDLGDLPVEEPSSSSSNDAEPPGVFIDLPPAPPGEPNDPLAVDMDWFAQLDKDFQGYDDRLVMEMERNTLK